MHARRFISAVFVCLLLLTLSSSGVAQKISATPKPTPTPLLATLPASVLEAELKAAGGGSFKLADYSGKVFVVNLWATWAGPCRMQVQSLVNLQEQFKSRGVVIVGLTTEDMEASAEVVREFVTDFGVNYQIGWASPEVATILMQGRDAIPQTYVISASGRIVKRWVGFNPQITPPQIEYALKEAIDEKAMPPNTSNGGNE